MAGNQDWYDPLAEEQVAAPLLTCLGCSGRISAAAYPPGVPCPYCQSLRRRLQDGTIAPRRSAIVWIIVIDLIITALIVLAVLYYFVWRTSAPVPGPMPAPEPEGVAVVSPVAAPDLVTLAAAFEQVPAADPIPVREPAPPPVASGAGYHISDDDGDGIPTISGYGATPAGIPFIASAAPAPRLPGGATALPPVPTISEGDMAVLDEDYVAVEWAQPLPQDPAHRREADVPDREFGLHVTLAVHAQVHESFAGKVIDGSRWQIRHPESPDPCQPYFTMYRDQLLIGSAGGRPQGPVALGWAGSLRGDFEVGIDYRWVMTPTEGQSGMYIEWLDGEGAVASLDLAAWGEEDDARRVLFQSRSAGAPDPVQSVLAPKQGRLRMTRSGGVLAVSVWDGVWQPIGETACEGGPLQLRLSGYSSTLCPRYAIALDDLEVKQHLTQRLAVQDHRQEPAAATALAGSGVVQEDLPITGYARPQVVSIREAPDASSKPARPAASLPYAMAGLPTGPVIVLLRNHSSHDLFCGLRRDRQGMDLRVAAGSSKQVHIPAGDYTALFRAAGHPAVLETARFHVPAATTSIAITLTDAE
jgi:hypothetical protein